MSPGRSPYHPLVVAKTVRQWQLTVGAPPRVDTVHPVFFDVLDHVSGMLVLEAARQAPGSGPSGRPGAGPFMRPCIIILSWMDPSGSR
ncbi:AfsA-related hotdog domain-containing protein [Streptomyces longisporus]|uniref:AfsA-related hotdog domain-containing protein n=1 Tax=Streptomyces longisporus TaxID=1948 RepID=UPI0031DBAD38